VLESTQKGSGDEIQLTDAIASMLQTHDFIAYQFDGIRYDCGSKFGYLQQMWKVTNYSLLLYAAIIAITKILTNLSPREFCVLWIANFAVLIAGSILIWMLHRSLKVRWFRLTETRKPFTEEFKNAWRGGKSEKEMKDNPDVRNSLVWLFQTVIVIGFACDSWILYRL